MTHHYGRLLLMTGLSFASMYVLIIELAVMRSEQIIASQQREIRQMKAMLDARG